MFRWFRARSNAPAEEAAPKPQRSEATQEPPEVALEAIRRETDVDARIDGYLRRSDLEARLWDDPQLAGAAALARIERLSRGRNKRINKAARARQRQFKNDQAEAKALADRANELVETATRLNQQQVLTQKDLTARSLVEEQWQALLKRRDAVDSEARSALSWPELPALNTSLPLAAPEPKPEAAEPAADPAAAVDNPETPAAGQAADAEAAEATEPLQTAQARLEAVRSALTMRLAASPDDLPTTTESAAQLIDLLEQHRQARSEGRALNQQIDWPKEGEQPPLVAELSAWLSARDEVIARGEAALKPLRAQLETDIDKLKELIDAGETHKAQSLHASIRRRQPEHIGLPRATLQSLRAAASALRRFGNWEQYATTPKRQGLVEAMERAAETPLPAPEQAERVKALRRDWQALGFPRGEAERAAQARFDQAAERAFEPCKAYFDTLAETRSANASAREDICAQLEGYLEGTDWRQADYQAAEQILRQARESWRNHHPVPRQQERALTQRFEALQERLHARLKQHWDANAAAKQRLIDSVLALNEAVDTPLEERLAAARSAQQSWKTVGRVPRKQDQALWTEFRAACDRLFEARSAAKDAVNAQRQAAANSARTLITEFERETAETETLAAEVATLRRFQGQLEGALRELPPRERRGLAEDGAAAAARYQRLIHEAEAAAGRDALALRERWDTAYGEDPDARPVEAPKGLFGPGQNSDDDVLRSLAVEAELLAGLESPEADAQLRMTLKVSALSGALGGATEPEATDPTAEVLKLADRWCALGSKGGSEASALRARFFGALRTACAAQPGADSSV